MIPSPLPTYDVRSFPGEVRMTSSAAGKRVIEGYAAVFNTRSQPLPMENGAAFIETIAPGAFRAAIKSGDVRGLFNHDSRYLLGRQSAGTLRVAEDTRGLHYEIDLGTRSYDKDLEESLERKDVTGSSFAFATVDDSWDHDGDTATRQLRSVHLFDVGPVVFPAYTAATSTVRSFAGYLERRSADLAKSKIVYPTPDQIALLNFFNKAEF